MSFSDLVEEMKRKRIYFLYCKKCRELANKEVWLSNEVADFVHLCEEHWMEFQKDGKYVSVYDLRS